MPNYRRVFIPGGCYFFTVNLLDRNSRMLVENIDALRNAVHETRQRFPFEIDAMVILPDHIHAVWTLPEGDADFSVRWRWIKIRFSKSIPNCEPRSPVRQARGERGIWQRRYWEHLIRDDRDFENHINYCWFNPVKHGHVATSRIGLTRRSIGTIATRRSPVTSNTSVRSMRAPTETPSSVRGRDVGCRAQ